MVDMFSLYTGSAWGSETLGAYRNEQSDQEKSESKKQIIVSI